MLKYRRVVLCTKRKCIENFNHR